MRTQAYSGLLPIALAAAAILALALSPAFALHPIISNPPAVGGSDSAILIPPGADALAAAIEAAGRGGTVILQAGVHTESSPILITRPVTLAGEPGAVLEAGGAPSVDYPLLVLPVIHIKNTAMVAIQGIRFRPPAGADGNTAILIEDSNSVVVAGNTIDDFQFGILNQRGNGAAILNNGITLTPEVLAGSLPEGHGIVNINGRAARINGNRVSGGTFGIWACDKTGIARNNVVTGNFIGLILCNVPDGDLLISGSDTGSSSPAAGWDVRNNLATFNAWGYLVIDGSNNNRLSSNSASNNSPYDMELTGDTFRFGFFTPASFENTVTVGGNSNLVIKDCGRKNRIIGSAQIVDTTTDPCD